MAKKLRSEIARFVYSARAIYADKSVARPRHPLEGRTVYRHVLVYFN